MQNMPKVMANKANLNGLAEKEETGKGEREEEEEEHQVECMRA